MLAVSQYVIAAGGTALLSGVADVEPSRDEKKSTDEAVGGLVTESLFCREVTLLTRASPSQSVKGGTDDSNLPGESLGEENCGGDGACRCGAIVTDDTDFWGD